MDKRSFLKNAGLMGLAAPLSFAHLKRAVAAAEHLAPADLAGDEDFWLKVRGDYDIKPDYIKLEGSFTQDMQKGDEAKENAKDLIQTLQSMDKKTVVPLVESAALLSTLWQAGVNFIQGYYLQAPSTEMNYDFSDNN